MSSESVPPSDCPFPLIQSFNLVRLQERMTSQISTIWTNWVLSQRSDNLAATAGLLLTRKGSKV